MCLAVVAFSTHSRYPWVIASNRDEYFEREALPLAWWQPPVPSPPILGGRDVTAGGTWLGLTADGGLALVTNVREPGRFDAGLPSRGDLVPLWLAGEDRGLPALRSLCQVPRNGFNLLVADLRHDRLAWAGNRAGAAQALSPGLHGLSNAALDTPWPKVQTLKRRLAAALHDTPAVDRLAERAFAALADRQQAADADLPSTGVPLQRERELSPAFIRIDGRSRPQGTLYGTRCSTLVIVEQHAGSRSVQIIERSFDTEGRPAAEARIGFTLPRVD